MSQRKLCSVFLWGRSIWHRVEEEAPSWDNAVLVGGFAGSLRHAVTWWSPWSCADFTLSVQFSSWKLNQTMLFFLNLNACWLDQYDVILTFFLLWLSNRWKLSILLKLLNISYLNKGHRVDFIEWMIAACGKSPAENTATDEEITSPPSQSVITDKNFVNKFTLWEHSFTSVFKELEHLTNSIICWR